MNLFYGNHFISVKLTLGIFLHKEEQKNNKNVLNYPAGKAVFTFGLFQKRNGILCRVQLYDHAL